MGAWLLLRPGTQRRTGCNGGTSSLNQVARMSVVKKSAHITPFLWFDANAEEAVDFYLSIFKNSRKVSEHVRAIDDPSGKKGTILTISFEIGDQQFTALNGGPSHKFTDAISFVVHCETQEEIDYYWSKLTEGGGNEVACGWLKDKFGLSWQIISDRLMGLLKNPKAMEALMKMKKLDIAELERAGRG